VAGKILEISSLSEYDFINLCANYLAILRNEQDNESELIARGYTKQQLAAVKKPLKRHHAVNIFNLKFTKPLTDFRYSLLNYVCVLFENYEKGNLPYEGTISEQPAQIIEIFQVIKSIRYEHQKAVEKEQLKKQSSRK
jgi:hypothetical protein